MTISVMKYNYKSNIQYDTLLNSPPGPCIVWVTMTTPVMKNTVIQATYSMTLC